MLVKLMFVRETSEWNIRMSEPGKKIARDGDLHFHQIGLPVESDSPLCFIFQPQIWPEVGKQKRKLKQQQQQQHQQRQLNLHCLQQRSLKLTGNEFWKFFVVWLIWSTIIFFFACREKWRNIPWKKFVLSSIKKSYNYLM
jgi:hypothetical protein